MLRTSPSFVCEAVSPAASACCEACGAGIISVSHRGRPRRFCQKCRPATPQSVLDTRRKLPKGERRTECCECGGFLQRRTGSGRPSLRCEGCRAKQARTEPKVPRAGTCLRCGAVFSTISDRRKWCSKACADGSVNPFPVDRRCIHCGRELPAGRRRKLCGPECYHRARIRLVQLQPIPCPECEKVFTPKTVQQKFCRKTCAKRHHYRKWTKWRKEQIRNGEKVDPTNVFIRDRWRCQICGVKTPQNLRGTFDPRAPELDHIIPVTAGGKDTYQNSQCACRECNQRKKDKPLDQMRLFG